MREGFDKKLRSIEEPRSAQNSVSMEELAEIGEYKSESVRKAADIQKKKRAIMDRLKLQLDALDGKAEMPKEEEHSKQVTYKDDKLFVIHSGVETQVSLGELLTDGEWGVSYSLGSEVPRNIRKIFFIESAKREIMDLYNEQIATVEADSWYNKGTGKDRAYVSKLRTDNDQMLKLGIISEKMVRNFLTKVAIDNNLPFRVVRSDVYEDIEHKIDFIVRFKLDTEAVTVEVVERNLIGIQLTTDLRQETLRKKQRQIEDAKKSMKYVEKGPVENIVLVSVPIDDATYRFFQWNETDKRPPGGPDKGWPESVKHEIFRGVLKRLFGSREIKEMWDKIKQNF